MRKSFFLATLAVVAMGSAVVNRSSNPSCENLNDTQIQNLEALADIELEDGGDYTVIFTAVDVMDCISGGKLKCPIDGFLG